MIPSTRDINYKSDFYENITFENNCILKTYSNQNFKKIQILDNSNIFNELTKMELILPLVLKFNDNDKTVCSNQKLYFPLLNKQQLPPSLLKDIAIFYLKLIKIINKYNLTITRISLRDICITCDSKILLSNFNIIDFKTSSKFPIKIFFNKLILPLKLINDNNRLINIYHNTNSISFTEFFNFKRKYLIKILSFFDSLIFKKKLSNFFYSRVIENENIFLLFFTDNYIQLLNYFIKKIFNLKAGNEYDLNNIKILINLEKKIKSYTFKQINQKWTDYYTLINLEKVIDDLNKSENNFSKISIRDRKILELLDNDYKNYTLLDIGCNKGYFSILSSNYVKKITAIDNDLGSIEGLYNLLKYSKANLKIKPLVGDFKKLNKQEISLYNSDIVLALGFLHHMRLVNLISWDEISHKLSLLTNHVLITEFKNETFAQSQNANFKDSILDYSLEKLVLSLKKSFNKVEVIGSFSGMYSESKRTLIVCYK